MGGTVWQIVREFESQACFLRIAIYTDISLTQSDQKIPCYIRYCPKRGSGKNIISDFVRRSSVMVYLDYLFLLICDSWSQCNLVIGLAASTLYIKRSLQGKTPMLLVF